MGRSCSITALYPGAALGPDRAKTGQTPAALPCRFWDLTNRGFSSSALTPGVLAHRAHSHRDQHQSQIFQASLRILQLVVRVFSRNVKTAPSTAAKSQRRFACGFASSLGSLYPSHTVFGWRTSSTTFRLGTLNSHRLVLFS